MLANMYHKRLEDLKQYNKSIEKLLEERDKLEEDLSLAKKTVRQLSSLGVSLETSNSAYIESIIKMIEESIAFAINKVLPFREYEVSLDYKANRNNGQLRLFLINSEGEKLPPRIIEGDMLNQVLSFAAIVHITLQKGYNRIFYDEAFASANIRSLQLINMLISYYSAQGIQFIFVTQNPALYAGLERTMIELVFDGKSVTDVETRKVEIDQKEFDTVSQITELFDNLTKGGQ